MRGFIVFVTLCLLVLIGVGWYRNWFGVQASSDADPNKTKIEVTIDRDKVRQDARSVTEGAGKAAENVRNLIVDKSVEGRVSSFDPAGGQLKVAGAQDQRELMFHVDDNTKVRIGSNDGRLSDLAPGRRVQVTYDSQGETHHARTIVVLEEKQS
jgi:hypothetical protein